MSNFVFQNDSLGRTHREGAGKGSAARHRNSTDEIGKLTSCLQCAAPHFPALLISKISLGADVQHEVSQVCVFVFMSVRQWGCMSAAKNVDIIIELTLQ